MIDTSRFPSLSLDSVLASGSAVLSYAEKINRIGLDSLQTIVESQFELITGVTELGSQQPVSLEDLKAPQDILQRQTDAATSVSQAVQTYAGKLGGALQHAQQAYLETGKEAVADFTQSFKKAA